MRLRIVLVGFGNVGREFARLLLERKSELAKVHGLRADVVAILTVPSSGPEESSSGGRSAWPTPESPWRTAAARSMVPPSITFTGSGPMS